MSRRIDHVVTFDATDRLLEAFGAGPRIIQMLGEIMSKLNDLNAEFKAALDAAATSITQDFDNLAAKLADGTITDDEIAAFRANLDRLKTIADPDPSFPPVEQPPAEEPPVETPPADETTEPTA